MSDNQKPYSETWDAERAYKRTRSMIINYQAKENPNTMDVCELRQVRVSVCANGTCPPELFDKALKQLFRNDEIAFGDRYACYPNDRDMANRAIKWVADRDEIDSAFIGRMNRLVSNGVLDP